MTSFKSDFLSIMEARGFIHQSSELDGIDMLAKEGKLTAYVGYDCTAPSLHIGNLATLMMLYWLQATGNKPIVLLGGATTLIGDPSGKDETRVLLSPEQITCNKNSIATVFAKILSAKSKSCDFLMLDNTDWHQDIGYIDMLRSVGCHFSINRMLTMDSVRLRLERQQEMSFIEFNYMILQAYDFVHLAREFGCHLQMGGSDQWGNIVSGIDLGRRMYGLKLHGITTPLLTTASGAKMGKTAQGAIWLDPLMCTAYEYWQYWRNVDDADVGHFARKFTTLPLLEISRLEKLQGAELNEAKKILAAEATTLLHGKQAAEKAAEAASANFEHNQISDGMPSIEITHNELSVGIGLLNVLVLCGMTETNGEARRLIQGKGVRINGQPVDDERYVIQLQDLTPDRIIKLSVGKKRHVLIRIL